MKLDKETLEEIKSLAHNYYMELAPDKERDTFLAKCYTNAVLDVLIKRGLLTKEDLNDT